MLRWTEHRDFQIPSPLFEYPPHAIVPPARRFVVAGSFANLSWGDAIERLKTEKLRATHERVETLKSQLRKVSLASGYDDVRALLHVHSAFIARQPRQDRGHRGGRPTRLACA